MVTLPDCMATVHMSDVSVQERRNSSASAMELRPSCINSTMQWWYFTPSVNEPFLALMTFDGKVDYQWFK